MANSASDARHSEADIRRTLIENNLIYGMLTLPSNMFYTVTLPATLWFFDKDKQDDKILFIDARNIFTQIDRAHREFNDEQIQNIAVISKLHRGNRTSFIELIDSYFEKKRTNYFTGKRQKFDELSSHNKAQHTLRESFDPFFESLHSGLKQLDKVVRQQEKEQSDVAKKAGKRSTTDRETKKLKEALELLHKEVKNAESFYKHIHWLQERFPCAQYEDVTGLCKLATQDEAAEQDYSLNPGRYVWVVIEEDGKTEEDFIKGLVEMNDELEKLTHLSKDLEKILSKNIQQLIGN
jgi:type I restriction enzyme M protein